MSLLKDYWRVFLNIRITVYNLTTFCQDLPFDHSYYFAYNQFFLENLGKKIFWENSLKLTKKDRRDMSVIKPFPLNSSLWPNHFPSHVTSWPRKFRLAYDWTIENRPFSWKWWPLIGIQVNKMHNFHILNHVSMSQKVIISAGNWH